MTASALKPEPLHPFALDYPSKVVGNHSLLVHADCFEWLRRVASDSIHAVVTDPPYGVIEFDLDHLAKRASGSGGVWRIPPSFDGHARAPLPRFTALNGKERARLRDFFVEWSRQLLRCVRPGGHVFVAGNAFLSQLVFEAIVAGGLEFRGEIIRLVGTLRGGDRPKGAELEFPDVSSMPRGAYEPWGLFRKPLAPGMTVADSLREFQTGGLRRPTPESPFSDVIRSERTPRRERDLAKHPSIKPQSLMRQLVRASLPLGVGTICDPFMGSGSTVAAAEAQGLSSVGVEINPEYYQVALDAVPALAGLCVERALLQSSLSL